MRVSSLILTNTVLLGAAVVTVLSACNGRTPAPPPSLYHDFGIVRHGLAKDHVFEVPLPETKEEIIPVTFWGDCACAGGTVMIQDAQGRNRLVSSLARPDARVRKGEKVLVSVTLDTSGEEPVSVKRKLAKARVMFESLRSANPQRYPVWFTFHWGIHAPVKLVPVAKVDFGELAYSNSFSQKIELHGNEPDHELRLGEIVVSDSRVTARVIRGEPPGPYLLKVTFRPDRKHLPGPFRTVVTIRTNIPNDLQRADFYKIPIEVTGTVTNDIVVIPRSRLEFGQFDFSKAKELFVTIIDHDRSRPAGFVVDGIHTNNGVDVSEHFQVRFEDLGNRRTRVRVKYLGTLAGIWLKGELTLAKNAGGPCLVPLTFRGLNTKR
jgi:hypothetical protein